MSSWNNNDNYGANVPLWITMSGAGSMTPNVFNANLVFANATANAIVSGATVGVFGIDANEARAARTGIHTGWVKRTVGSGGRAGRIQDEVLVALNTMNGDYDNTYANTAIIYTTQPTDNVIKAGANTKGTISVTVDTIPGAGVVGTAPFPITYAWEFNNGIQWLSTTLYGNAFPFGANTGTLTVASPNATLQYSANSTLANTWKVRCNVASLDQFLYSANALITVMP